MQRFHRELVMSHGALGAYLRGFDAGICTLLEDMRAFVTIRDAIKNSSQRIERLFLIVPA